jgi:predicted TIM-barrel fold metal-dependent hydrolase
MMLIDAHINLTADGRWFTTGLDASAEAALRQMDEAGIAMAGVIVPPGRANRDFALDLAVRRKDRFFVGFTVAEATEAELAEMAACLAKGDCRFVKIHPRWLGIAPLDPRLTPFFLKAAELGRPALVCSFMRGPRLPMRDLEPLVFDELARRHPKLSIVLGHAGTYRPLDALAVAQSHENVYLDFSHVLAYFAGSSLAEDFAYAIRRLDRRAIFGSDFPEQRIGDYLAVARGMTGSFDKDFQRDGFFGGHASRLYLAGRTG